MNKILSSGTVREQQNAYQILSGTKDPEADHLLAQQLDDLLAGKTRGELQLDLLDAASQCSDGRVKEKVAQFNGRRAGQTNVTLYSECLTGGDALRGRRIFHEKVEASCMRCHKINGEGGEAAPDLSKIGARADRNYILESITFPNAKIAPGFETIQVALKNGTSNVGIVKRENADELDLMTPDDGLVKIKKSEIQTRVQTLSGMLDNLRDLLTKREIRDLVEYLATLK
jgi:quinoprotein glucose dehydrogenase